MFNIITKGIAKVFGTKSDRDLKEITPYVAKINTEFDKLNSLSHDELRAQTQDLKNVIASALSEIDSKIEELTSKSEGTTLSINEKDYILQFVQWNNEKT